MYFLYERQFILFTLFLVTYCCSCLFTVIISSIFCILSVLASCSTIVLGLTTVCFLCLGLSYYTCMSWTCKLLNAISMYLPTQQYHISAASVRCHMMIDIAPKHRILGSVYLAQIFSNFLENIGVRVCTLLTVKPTCFPVLTYHPPLLLNMLYILIFLLCVFDNAKLVWLFRWKYMFF